MSKELVEKTWGELGFKIRPLGHWVFIRTELIAKETPGGILLTDKSADFYEGMPHQKLYVGTVCSVGSKAQATVSEGDRICYQRLFFARYCYLQDGTMLGWINSENIPGLDTA